MELTKIAGECVNGVDCEGVYLTDRGTVVVQGDLCSTPGIPKGEARVEITIDLLKEAARAAN